VHDIYKLASDPDVIYATTPKGLEKFTDFTHAIGGMKTRPVSCKDLVFPELHGETSS